MLPAVHFDLDFPIEIGGVDVASLSLRYPERDDLAFYRRQRGVESDRVLAMVARLAGVSAAALLDLDHVDMLRLLDACKTLIEDSADNG